MSDIASPPIPDNLQKFELRCWSRALLWREGELELTAAVDHLEALASELDIAPDLAQATMAEFFARARRP